MQNGKAACGTGAGIRKLLVRGGRPNPVRDGLAVLLSLVSPRPGRLACTACTVSAQLRLPDPGSGRNQSPGTAAPTACSRRVPGPASYWTWHRLLPGCGGGGGGRACNMQVASRQRVRPARGLGWSQPRSPALSRAGASSREIQSRPSGARGGAVHLDSRPRPLRSPHVPRSNRGSRKRGLPTHMAPFPSGPGEAPPPHPPSGL